MKLWHVVLKCGTEAVETVEKIMGPKEDVLHGDGTRGGTKVRHWKREVYIVFLK